MLRAALSAARAGRVANAAVRPNTVAQGRRFASGGHHENFHGFIVPHVDQNFKKLGETMMAVMWFWIFYRGYHDGKAVLVRWDCGVIVECVAATLCIALVSSVVPKRALCGPLWPSCGPFVAPRFAVVTLLVLL